MSSSLISIPFLTYNSEPKKTMISLMSIAMQEYPYKELIISDDGSQNIKCSSIIETFIKEHKEKFTRILFLKNPANQGTIKNLNRARNHVEGEITIGLSPGDLFYDRSTLGRLLEFYEANKRPPFFCGLQRSYSYDYAIKKSKDIDYMNPNIKEIRYLKNPEFVFLRLLKGNFLSGASGFVYSREFLSDPKYRIPPEISLLEDYIIVLLLSLHGYKIPILKEFVMWYEYGSGVSTSKSSKEFRNVLQMDLYRFLIYLQTNIESILDKSKIVKKCEMRKAIEKKIKRENRKIALHNKLRTTANPLFRKCIGAVLCPDVAAEVVINRLISSYRKRLARMSREELIRKQGDGFRTYIEEFYNNSKWESSEYVNNPVLLEYSTTLHKIKERVEK